MNLQENIFRIKQIMGLLNEQTEKVIEVVTGSFTANNCDELHAFESTCPSKVFTGGECEGGTKLVGEMHEKMRIKLDDIYRKKGINPKVSKVEVSVNGMTVTWTCTIVESTDGKAWVGFTSRGAGCNNDIIARAESAVVSNDVDSIKKRINDKYKEPIIEIEKVNDFIYNGGGNSFRQIFYRYTRPKRYPPQTATTETQPATTQTATETQIQTNTSSLTVQEKLKKGQQLTPEELNVKGDLALGFSKVKSLPNGLKVGGNLFLNNCDNLTSLPNGLEVGGSLFLMDVKINSLPKRLVVGGSLDLTGSAITSLPNGLKVGGLLKVDNTKLIKYPDEKLFKMIGSNGYIKLGIFRKDSNYTTNLEAPSNNQELPWEKQTSSDTTATQVAQTTGGETPTTSTPTQTTGGETPTTSTPTQTTAKPYPSIDNPFTPRNGDPWKYAFDGTKLIVKSPTTGNEYNLKDPNYFTTYPYSKLKNEEQLNNAIASIKNAYGDELGMQ